YCASLVNLDKVSFYKYQNKNNAFDEQKQRLYEKKSSLSKEKSSLLDSQKRTKEYLQHVNKTIEKLSIAKNEHNIY
ncbi:type III secretion protein, partial [Escherichia coli]